MKTFSLFCFFLLVFDLNAQLRTIECFHEADRNNVYTIIGQSKEIGTYTIRLNFSVLNGFEAGISKESFYSVSFGRNQLLKLTPRASSVPALQYSYNYYEGKLLGKPPQIPFIYLLPSTPGHSIRSLPSFHLAEKMGKEKPESFQAYYFQIQAGDTVCAARGGIVTMINNEAKAAESAEMSFSQNRNFLRIEHKDGTIADYTFTSPITPFIQKGDLVLPGAPVAKFGSEGDKYGIFLNVRYLDESKLSIALRESPEKPKYLYTYLNLKFLLDGGPATVEDNKEYIIEHPDAIISSELSKQQRKKLGKGQ